MNLNEKRIIHNLAVRYENFLTRAFKTDQRIRRPNKQEYINLVDAENGNKFPFLPAFDKQLKEVKSRLERAINIFISKTSNKEQIKVLKNLKSKVFEIESHKDISEIIEVGLENTKKFI